MPVKLYISARNLKNLDTFSKSDPFCTLFEKGKSKNDWYRIGRTETIDNDLNPDFKRAIDIDFYFEKKQ